MAKFVYIDETGSVGKGAARQPLLTLAAVIIHEDQVQPLATAMKKIAVDHLGWAPSGFEFHGNEIWNGTNHWQGKTPPQLLAVYESVIGLLDEFDLDIAYSSINKAGLRACYSGKADGNAYLLALQFLLEKIDCLGQENKILVADETKEHQLRAVSMVADLREWGLGEVPGSRLTTVIDSMHFVRSHASPGVQLADLVAYLLQRNERGTEPHRAAQESRARMSQIIGNHTRTYRQPWPPLS